MPFIGKQPQVGAYSKLDAITTSATATYNLTLGSGAYYPQSANHLLVSLNGVMQAPQDSFTVSGSTITFASALTSSDSVDFIMALGDTLDIGTPSDGTVTSAKLSGSITTPSDLTVTDGAVVNLTGDGTIIDLQAGGTTVGSIDVDSGDNISFGATTGGGSGLYMFGAAGTSPFILPMKEGALSDNTVTLGDDARRFKDLYLSGGVYLGGAGAANHLDDYEEGTWTPFWGGSVSDPSQSYTLQSGRYTKIGRMVYVSFIVISSGTPSGGSGDLLIAGLPFAFFATSIQTQGYIGIVNNISNDMGASQLMLVGQTASGNVNVMKCSGSSTTSSSNLAVSACHNSGSRIDGTFIYSIA